MLHVVIFPPFHVKWLCRVYLTYKTRKIYTLIAELVYSRLQTFLTSVASTSSLDTHLICHFSSNISSLRSNLLSPISFFSFLILHILFCSSCLISHISFYILSPMSYLSFLISLLISYLSCLIWCLVCNPTYLWPHILCFLSHTSSYMRFFSLHVSYLVSGATYVMAHLISLISYNFIYH